MVTQEESGRVRIQGKVLAQDHCAVTASWLRAASGHGVVLIKW